MTLIHFLYFPVEELSENGATIAVQRNSREKNVKAWWWVGWDASPLTLPSSSGDRSRREMGTPVVWGREVENFEGGSTWMWTFKCLDLATCDSRSWCAVGGTLWGSWES